jgi:hypothetical protein
LQDAVDAIIAASQSGNVSTVPDKFLTSKYKDTIKALLNVEIFHKIKVMKL